MRGAGAGWQGGVSVRAPVWNGSTPPEYPVSIGRVIESIIIIINAPTHPLNHSPTPPPSHTHKPHHPLTITHSRTPTTHEGGHAGVRKTDDGLTRGRLSK